MSAANVLWGLVCGFLYLLALEIRNRQVLEDLSIMKEKTGELHQEIEKLKADMRLKKSINDEKKSSLGLHPMHDKDV